MNKRMFIRTAAVTALAALGLGFSVSGQAAGYPDHSITAIVPFPAGGSTDQIARALGPKIGQELGQGWIVENRPGATGAIGAADVKRAEPDGYKVLVASIGVFAVNPFLRKNLPYDPAHDFDMLTIPVRAPNVLVVNPNFPAKNVGDLVTYLKQHPGKVTFANSGAGSSDHLTAALFMQQTGTSGVNVPYKGGAPAVTDLLGGHVDASFQNLNAIIGYVRSGKLKALAITSEKRSQLLPDVPTLDESGIKNADVYSWQGIAGPKGMPKDVKAKLYHAISGALKDPGVKSKLEAQGFEIVDDTPEDAQSFVNKELARWKQVIQAAHITLE